MHRSDREELLFQTFTTGVGHCNLTGPQILTAIGAIDLWVRTGVRPTAAQFPAPLGFNNAFVPPRFLTAIQMAIRQEFHQ